MPSMHTYQCFTNSQYAVMLTAVKLRMPDTDGDSAAAGIRTHVFEEENKTISAYQKVRSNYT